EAVDGGQRRRGRRGAAGLAHAPPHAAAECLSRLPRPDPRRRLRRRSALGGHRLSRSAAILTLQERPTMSFPDPITEGLRRGWSVLDADAPSLPGEAQFDVVIVGTGAGGGTTAEILSHAGLRVLLVEEGPLRSSRDFRMRESEAYPQLYQES